jgi:APA family basic amino acid/polyamine antiporter
VASRPGQGAALSASEPTLRRALSLPLLTLYGVGTIIGGGFYALVGKVAAEAGTRAPMSFMLAALIALFSALSYASLAVRYPVSAGEAAYVRAAFRRRWLSALVGWLVIATGLVSAATLSRAIVGFIGDFISIPLFLALTLIVGLLGAIAAWGIAEAVWLSVVITLIEVAGLVLVVALEGDVLGDLPSRWRELVPEFRLEAWHGIGLGGFLAFYAFVGFEDMVNVAEEVRDPTRTMPLAIAFALGGTTVLYVVVSTVAVLAVPIDELASSGTPVARIVADHGFAMIRAMGFISVMAGVNGALIQIIMAARVVYGMAARGGAPTWFGHVNEHTRTPIRATVSMAILVLALALWLPLGTLAKITSAIILVVFAMVNLTLIVLRVRESRSTLGPSLGVRDVLPVIGLFACAAFLAFQGSEVWMGTN